jgi:hypothetical protein
MSCHVATRCTALQRHVVRRCNDAPCRVAAGMGSSISETTDKYIPHSDARGIAVPAVKGSLHGRTSGYAKSNVIPKEWPSDEVPVPEPRAEYSLVPPGTVGINGILVRCRDLTVLYVVGPHPDPVPVACRRSVPRSAGRTACSVHRMPVVRRTCLATCPCYDSGAAQSPAGAGPCVATCGAPCSIRSASRARTSTPSRKKSCPPSTRCSWRSATALPAPAGVGTPSSRRRATWVMELRARVREVCKKLGASYDGMHARRWISRHALVGTLCRPFVARAPAVMKAKDVFLFERPPHAHKERG